MLRGLRPIPIARSGIRSLHRGGAAIPVWHIPIHTIAQLAAVRNKPLFIATLLLFFTGRIVEPLQGGTQLLIIPFLQGIFLLTRLVISPDKLLVAGRGSSRREDTASYPGCPHTPRPRPLPDGKNRYAQIFVLFFLLPRPPMPTPTPKTRSKQKTDNTNCNK